MYALVRLTLDLQGKEYDDAVTEAFRLSLERCVACELQVLEEERVSASLVNLPPRSQAPWRPLLADIKLLTDESGRDSRNAAALSRSLREIVDNPMSELVQKFAASRAQLLSLLHEHPGNTSTFVLEKRESSQPLGKQAPSVGKPGERASRSSSTSSDGTVHIVLSRSENNLLRPSRERHEAAQRWLNEHSPNALDDPRSERSRPLPWETTFGDTIIDTQSQDTPNQESLPNTSFQRYSNPRSAVKSVLSSKTPAKDVEAEYVAFKPHTRLALTLGEAITAASKPKFVLLWSDVDLSAAEAISKDAEALEASSAPPPESLLALLPLTCFPGEVRLFSIFCTSVLRRPKGL